MTANFLLKILYFRIGINFVPYENILVLHANYDSGKTKNDTLVHGVLRNVSFTDGRHVSLQNVAINFLGCIFENNVESAIQALSSKVIFEGRNIFQDNSAFAGGRIQLLDSSYMYFQPHTHILFARNHAEEVGGAIYIGSKSQDPCFFYASSPSTIQIEFLNNTADYAGSSLYGPVSSCCTRSPCMEFHEVFNISNSEFDPSVIASDPFEVCFAMPFLVNQIVQTLIECSPWKHYLARISIFI